jgi:hypothetical protein
MANLRNEYAQHSLTSRTHNGVLKNGDAHMKMLSTILGAALIAGSATVAMAQGAESDTTARPGAPQGADANPSSPGAMPSAGNPDGTKMMPGAAAAPMNRDMRTAPVSGTPATKESSDRPGQKNVNPDPGNVK